MDEANESPEVQRLARRVDTLEAVVTQLGSKLMTMSVNMQQLNEQAEQDHARYLNALGTLEARQAATVAAMKGEDAREAFEAFRERFAEANANVYDPTAWGQRPAWLAKLMPTKPGG